jgi:hypothetical protein
MSSAETKTCKSCRTEIHHKAKRCPNCRSDQRSWPARHKILTGLGVLFVFVALSSAVRGSSAPAATSAPTSATAVPTTVPVLKVSSLTLAQQFDANTVTALTRYTGRIVQTSGIATNVSRDLMGRYYVAFKPSDDSYSGFTSMQCYVSGPDAVTSVVNGQPVTVRGRIDDQTMSIISIKDCSVQPWKIHFLTTDYYTDYYNEDAE